jgi:hypothetical protein
MPKININLAETLLLHEVTSPSPETIPEEHLKDDLVKHFATRSLCINIGSALVELMEDPKPDRTVSLIIEYQDLWFLRDHLSAGMTIEGLHLERDTTTGLPIKERKSGLIQVGGDRLPVGMTLIAKIYSELLKIEGRLDEDWSLQDILGE